MNDIDKIIFLGDSITNGAGASCVEKNYVSLVGKKFGAQVLNFGVGGTRIAKQSGNDDYPEYFLLRAKRMPCDADFVFVFGGTNDFGHGDAEIGDLDCNSDLTFCGAVNNLVDYLIYTYGKDRLCFILPLHRWDENNTRGEGFKKVPSLILSGYVDVLKNVLDKKGIEWLDINHKFPTPLSNKGDDLTIDGLHPNDVGHEIIANEIVKFLLSKQQNDKGVKMKQSTLNLIDDMIKNTHH